MVSKLQTGLANQCRLRDLILILFLGLFSVVLAALPISRTILAGRSPEVVLILSLYLALKAEMWMAVLGAFVLGFFRGGYAAEINGLYQLELILAVYIVKIISRKANLSTFIPLFITVFILSLFLNMLMSPMIATVFGYPEAFQDYFIKLRTYSVIAALTAVISPAVFHLLEALTRISED